MIHHNSGFYILLHSFCISYFYKSKIITLIVQDYPFETVPSIQHHLVRTLHSSKELRLIIFLHQVPCRNFNCTNLPSTGVLHRHPFRTEELCGWWWSITGKEWSIIVLVFFNWKQYVRSSSIWNWHAKWRWILIFFSLWWSNSICLDVWLPSISLLSS